MLLKKLNKKMFDFRDHFNYKFLFFLILFSFGLSVAIYFKENSSTKRISLLSVIIWQLTVWVPLIIIFPMIRILLNKTKNKSKPRRWTYLVISGSLMTFAHFVWFYLVSNEMSPYLGVSKTKYGVFPFFFIFWIMIDVILISVTTIFLEMIRRASVLKSSKISFHTLNVKQGSKVYLLKAEEILWIEAEDYYVRIHTVKGKFLERKSLKSILQFLPAEQFMRVHRSTVVNINAITEMRNISAQKGEVKLNDGSIRSVSRTYLKPLKDFLSNQNS